MALWPHNHTFDHEGIITTFEQQIWGSSPYCTMSLWSRNTQIDHMQLSQKKEWNVLCSLQAEVHILCIIYPYGLTMPTGPEVHVPRPLNAQCSIEKEHKAGISRGCWYMIELKKWLVTFLHACSCHTFTTVDKLSTDTGNRNVIFTGRRTCTIITKLGGKWYHFSQ